ncbi:MAG: hypothetical protein JST00_35265 [Deltaproteobacteria bacterium]|nr:hypothetical protein [Deltaproteobacteria bacterium]
MARPRVSTCIVLTATVAAAWVFSACGSSARETGPADAGADAEASEPAPPPPYSVVALDRARISSREGEPNFQKARGSVTLQPGPYARVVLIVDLDTTCFPFARWKDDPPPAGHNWPASCDAFDRNFDVYVIDPAAPSAPALELVHAITPFGGPLHIETDVTDVFAALKGARTIEVEIPTYSDAAGKVSGAAGGWFVSARLDVTPGPAPRDVVAVIPVMRGVVTEGGVAKTFPFALPPGATSARLEWVATGHGGGSDRACIGPADEFCERTHTLTFDGAKLAEQALWRDDCDKLCTTTANQPGAAGPRTYCAENPCGAPQSVRAPRANWCPGSVTPMKSFDLPVATEGPHTFGLTVDTIAAGGSWRTSAKVFAYR